MIDFSIVSIFFYLFQGFRKAVSMALSLNSSPPSSSLPPPLSWAARFISQLDQTPDHLKTKTLHDQYSKVCQEDEKIVQEKDDLLQQNSDTLMNEGSNILRPAKISKKRPARLVVPECYPGLELSKMSKKFEKKEIEVEGRDYFLASKKGRREEMEDGYGVMVDILGHPKQAFFVVIDGHGGRAAVDYVSQNLGRNIVKALENGRNDEKELVEDAIRGGYLITDKEFVSQGVSSGACAASVLIKDGEIHVANAGDCRVVLCRNGVANVLTNDHRLSREDERLRIENSGGFVTCCNGVWRVQGTLAVSRAIGDLHLKEWIIPEPEIMKLPLTSDCDFLIMASDGLWDKVNDQEAVDIVLGDNNNLPKSCRTLVDISCSRGSLDDITVMVINLTTFMAPIT